MKLKIVLAIFLVALAAAAVVNAAVLVFDRTTLPKNVATNVNDEASRLNGLTGKVQLLGDDRGGGWP